MIALAYLVCALVWGTTWFAIRVSIGPDGYPTLASAAVRMLLAGAIMLALWATRMIGPGPRSRQEVGWLTVAGAINGVSYALVYKAEEQLPGAVAAVIFGTMPLMTAMAVVLTRTEKVGLGSVLGSLAALLGVALIFSDRLQVSRTQAMAVMLCLTAVGASTIYSVIVKRHAGALHPMASAGIFLFVSGVTLTLLTLAFERQPLPWPPPPAATLALLYLVVFGSVLAFGCYFYLIQKARLMTTSTLVFVQPIIAVTVDALWEHQVRLGPIAYVGMAVTLGGVLASTLIPARK